MVTNVFETAEQTKVNYVAHVLWENFMNCYFPRTLRDMQFTMDNFNLDESETAQVQKVLEQNAREFILKKLEEKNDSGVLIIYAEREHLFAVFYQEKPKIGDVINFLVKTDRLSKFSKNDFLKVNRYDYIDKNSINNISFSMLPAICGWKYEEVKLD